MTKEERKSYEVIEYGGGMPFRIHNITKQGKFDADGNVLDVNDHWHEEIEIVYTYAGNAIHYIDGVAYKAQPDSLFIINSESIHKIISDEKGFRDGKITATVLNINYHFMKQLIPDIQERYFNAYLAPDEAEVASEIMKELANYPSCNVEIKRDQEIYLIGRVCELISFLYQIALGLKEDILPTKNAHNLERLRSVMEFVQFHYDEPITQSNVAEEFYFTKEYFSRFFKKNTGMTFKRYLTRYRVNMARKKLIETDSTILQIALETGFSDSRGLIVAFKKTYDVTPFQYRQLQRKCKKGE